MLMRLLEPRGVQVYFSSNQYSELILWRSNSCPVWPLVAVSHQMTVRNGPLLPFDKLKKTLPWIDLEDVP